MTIEATKSLVVDGAELNVDPSMTFGAISESLRMKWGPSRVLTEIIVDGRSIDLVEEEALRHKKIADVGQVVLKTRNVVELFRESLGLAPRICDALVMDCGDIEAFFEKNEMRAAQERIGEMTSLLEWLLQLVSGMQNLSGRKLDEMSFGGVQVSESMNKMQVLLAKLHVQLAGHQWVEFRQTLKTEFLPAVGEWRGLFADASTQWSPQQH